LACDHDAKGLTIALPAAPLDPNVSVVVLEVEGDLKIVSP
jgi:hypothetical protein